MASPSFHTEAVQYLKDWRTSKIEKRGDLLNALEAALQDAYTAGKESKAPNPARLRNALDQVFELHTGISMCNRCDVDWYEDGENHHLTDQVMQAIKSVD